VDDAEGWVIVPGYDGKRLSGVGRVIGVCVWCFGVLLSASCFLLFALRFAFCFASSRDFVGIINSHHTELHAALILGPR
jgi:hypothetical protein